MFYMPNAKMLFGDAKVSCDGESNLFQASRLETNHAVAIKVAVDSKL